MARRKDVYFAPSKRLTTTQIFYRTSSANGIALGPYSDTPKSIRGSSSYIRQSYLFKFQPGC